MWESCLPHVQFQQREHVWIRLPLAVCYMWKKNDLIMSHNDSLDIILILLCIFTHVYYFFQQVHKISLHDNKLLLFLKLLLGVWSVFVHVLIYSSSHPLFCSFTLTDHTISVPLASLPTSCPSGAGLGRQYSYLWSSTEFCDTLLKKKRWVSKPKSNK